MEKKTTKIILGTILVVIIASWLAIDFWSTQRLYWINQGRGQMSDEIGRKAVIDNRDRLDVTREIEKGIREGVDRYTKEFERSQADRQATDLVSRENIEKMIARDPDFYTSRYCTVPDSMLAERNKIREGS